MTANPSPKRLATYLRDMAAKVESSEPRALDLAALLADRGYPTSTASAGVGGRSSDRTSSVERAILLGPEPQAGKLRELQDRHFAAWNALRRLEAGIDDVLSHASTNDQLPPGTGYCSCGANCALDRRSPTFCAPRQNGPSDRLKVGLAPNCYKRFLRWQDSNPGGTVVDWKHVTRRAREVADERARQLAAGRAALR